MTSENTPTAADLLRRASEGPQGQAEAREPLRTFGETLRAHGIGGPGPETAEPGI